MQREEEPKLPSRLRSQCGDPRKAGRFSVGHVLCGTEFSHEFNHSTEDRPAWDFGREVACYSTLFVITPTRVFGRLPVTPGSLRAACIGWGRRWSAVMAIRSRGF